MAKRFTVDWQQIIDRYFPAEATQRTFTLDLPTSEYKMYYSLHTVHTVRRFCGIVFIYDPSVGYPEHFQWRI